MEPVLLCDIADGLCTLTLNRPGKLNALNAATFRLLDAAIDSIVAAEEELGCILLRGAGRSFCAGHDLDDIASGAETKAAQRYETGVLERFAELPIPIVAAVQGHCLTGGLELALAADIIIAAESARFADTHSKWDLVPVWGLSQRLPRRIGHARAKEMMFTGRTLSGHEAAAIGIANRCVPDTDLDQAVRDSIAAMLANAWRANKAIKRLMQETEGMTLRGGIAYELHHTAGRGPEMADRLAKSRAR